MKKKILLIIILNIIMIFSFISCNKEQNRPSPKNPVVVTLKTYYNDIQLKYLKSKVEEFNETIGFEQGIIVEIESTGFVKKLNESLIDSANDEVASKKFPDMFITYKSILPYLEGKVEFVDYSKYFSDKELEQYNKSLMDIGKVGRDKRQLMLPIGSSTDIIYINKTDFDIFKYTLKITDDDLSTYEGIAEAAEKYYKYTDSLTQEQYDGKSLYGVDSLAEHIFAICSSMGKELVEEKNGDIILNFDHEVARKLWDIYYVPFVKGYFSKHGRFVSEDLKTGESIVVLASTSSAPYMPSKIMEENGYIRDIRLGVLKGPRLRDYDKISINQGGGIFITKNLEIKEYACAEFIKWFTNINNNICFALNASYMPIRNDNADSEYIQREAKKNYTPFIIPEAINISLEQRKNSKSYIQPDIAIYEDVRSTLDNKFLKEIQLKRREFVEELSNGKDYDELTSIYFSDRAFEEWRKDIIKALEREIKASNKKQ